MANNKDYAQLLPILYLGVIIGVLYGLIKAIINISTNYYLDYGLYNIALLEIQHNTNKFTLLFVIIALFLLVIPITIFNRFNSQKIDLKALDSRNFRTLLYSLFGVLLLAIVYYLYLSNIANLIKTNSLFVSLSTNLNLGIKLQLIFLFLLLTEGIILISFFFLSKVNIFKYLTRILEACLTSRIFKVLGLGTLLFVVLFNITLYGFQKLQPNEGPNVILISIDTLRADHLGAYGYERETSPNIDRLANEGILFENAFSQAPWTLPAMSSIHTSLYPSEHGVIDYDRRIDNKYITIAEFLKNYHYKTIGVISMPFVDSKYGFSQGFDIFDEQHISGPKDVSSKLITHEAIKYVDLHRDNKFFLWIHYFDPHGSYINHKEIQFTSENNKRLPEVIDPGVLSYITNNLDDADLQYIKDLYDEEIAFTDKYIGKLLEKLDNLNLMDNTIIIVTSDHGEEFMERGGFGHRKLLYNELIRVPLIIYNPIDKNSNSIINQNNVETRSIAKTIVNIIGIPNSPFSGTDLLSNKQSKDKSYVFSNVYKKGDILKESVISKNLKLIRNKSDDDIYELYDLYSDKKEKNNIYRSNQISILPIENDLISQLDKLPENNTQNTKKADINSEDINKLKALGYLQ